MKNELSKMVEKCSAEDKPNFELEMDCFFNLFTRFLSEKSKRTRL
jgi:UDP-N-acetylglucosamine pyrophosphorylase